MTAILKSSWETQISRRRLLLHQEALKLLTSNNCMRSTLVWTLRDRRTAQLPLPDLDDDWRMPTEPAAHMASSATMLAAAFSIEASCGVEERMKRGWRRSRFQKIGRGR